MSFELENIVLPVDMWWEDEFDYTPIGQNVEHNLDGSFAVEEDEKLAGRPITLSGDIRYSWLTRQDVLAVYAMASEKLKVMTLTIADGREFSVMFRHYTGKPISAEPVFQRVPPLPDDEYYLTIRLMEV